MKNRIPIAGGVASLLTLWFHVPARGAEMAPPTKAGLEDLVSGRTEFDGTDTDEDVRTLSCSLENDKGSVEFSLSPAPSGACRWTIRQGAAMIDEGGLDSGNGWKASRGGLAPGLYTLEVTRQGDGAFRRRIDFATGLENAKAAKKCQDALKLHGAKDYPGLMKALRKVDIQAAAVPPQMREDLAWARLDGLLFFRKFEEILPAIEAFRIEYPTSAHMGAVTEAEMAARFERGLKMTLEAVRFKNASSADRRAKGVADLGRFLSLAASHPGSDYTVLPKQNLRQNLWTARIILGEEQAASAEISDVALREEFRLQCALLLPKTQPDRADENLQRMKNFLADYPDSPARPRVEFDMATVALNEGIRLVRNTKMPGEAPPYFELAREVFGRVTEDKEAGISPADVAESWDGILRSYYWERDANWQNDEAKLMAWTERMISMSKPGDSSWRQAKLYQGDLLLHQRKYDEAATVLDELVALGFKGNPSHDGRTSFAVTWRIAVATRIGDEEKAEQLRQWVRESNCVDSIRRDWVKGESR
jgi:hypothetical protein